MKVQSNLKIKIEAQVRFLERIAGQHRNRATPHKLANHSLPYHCLHCVRSLESNAKDFETDSEADKNEIESGERRTQALKKPGVEEDNLASSIYTFASFNPGAYDQNILLNREETLSYTANDISFPWNIPVCSSPLVPSFL